MPQLSELKIIQTEAIPVNAGPYRLHFRKVAGLGTMRSLIAAGALCLLNFLWWLVTATHIGYAPLFWLLAVSMGFKVLRMVHEWAHYAQVRVPVPPAYPPALRNVDVLTTACPGEPRAMIIRTLEAMQAIRYPHTSYLCDEGDDPVLRAACARLGVVHVTRAVKVDAKAGNINHALRRATGEVCVVLDPDHVPFPDFLDRVMPYFEDPQVGFVQVVQAYGNQHESLVARGAAEQTYHFYGPLMMGMNGYGTVQAIGANCTFRRAALDSIGGHAAGLTEDMHTAMRLHAAGWLSAYVPQVVSRGLVPASLAAFYSQQLKWSRGAFDLLFRVYPRVCGRFTWTQRLHYLLLPLYFFSGVVALIDLALPVLSLGMSQFPWMVSLGDLARHVLPLLGVSLLIRCYAQRWLRQPGEGGLHLAGGLLQVGAWWVYTLGFVYAVLGVRVPYLPTPKEGRRGNEWRLALPNLVLAAVLLAACKYGRVVAYGPYTSVMVALALFNIAILVAATFMGQHQVVRNFVADMATRPYRGLVLGLHRASAALATALMPLLRRFGPAVAVGGLVLTGALYYRHAVWLARVPPEWLLTGVTEVRVGRAVAPIRAAPGVATFAGQWTESPAPAESEIAALPLPALEPGTPLPAQVGSLIAAHRIPLLSWPVSAGTARAKTHWAQLARQIGQVPGPVLLRPQLAASTPAGYRRRWRDMVRAFRTEGVVNVVWVWSPEAADTLLHKFPGAAYVDWIASPLVARDGKPHFARLRKQLTQDINLHHLPVLLLAPAPRPNAAALVQQLNRAYPEVKAVVFSPAGTGPLFTANPGSQPATAAGLGGAGLQEESIVE